MPKKIRPIRVEGNIAYIPLTNGYEAVIDADDAHMVAAFNWYAAVTRRSDGSIRSVYAVRAGEGARCNGKTILMHRVILGGPIGMSCDHRDGNGLNNRRDNLRAATPQQNSFNQRIGTNSTTGVKGVGWHKAMGKWRADIMVDGKKHYLGCFDTVDDASTAYADASVRLHGEFGRM